VLLMSGDASAARVADAMGLHERTLRRRLHAEGETLHSLLAQARFEVACQLLRETRLGLQDIADALGYAEAPVFVRAFRGWAGCTPGHWRVRQLKPPAVP
jgi:AraC-like DNA-binding protein